MEHVELQPIPQRSLRNFVTGRPPLLSPRNLLTALPNSFFKTPGVHYVSLRGAVQLGKGLHSAGTQQHGANSPGANILNVALPVRHRSVDHRTKDYMGG